MDVEFFVKNIHLQFDPLIRRKIRLPPKKNHTVAIERSFLYDLAYDQSFFMSQSSFKTICNANNNIKKNRRTWNCDINNSPGKILALCYSLAREFFFRDIYTNLNTPLICMIFTFNTAKRLVSKKCMSNTTQHNTTSCNRKPLVPLCRVQRWICCTSTVLLLLFALISIVYSGHAKQKCYHLKHRPIISALEHNILSGSVRTDFMAHGFVDKQLNECTIKRRNAS